MPNRNDIPRTPVIKSTGDGNAEITLDENYVGGFDYVADVNGNTAVNATGNQLAQPFAPTPPIKRASAGLKAWIFGIFAAVLAAGIVSWLGWS